MFSGTHHHPLRVLIAGGGVAGVECLLALHDQAAEHLDITMVSERAELVEGAVALGEPFGNTAPQHIDVAALVTAQGGWFVHGAIESVDTAAHTATLLEGPTLGYDVLIMAVGAAPRLPWGRALELEVTSARMLDMTIAEATATGAHRVVIAIPPGPHWALPGYELALMLARDERCGRLDVDLVTRERAPLQVFGPVVSEAVAAELADAGVQLHPSRGMTLGQGDPVAVRLVPGGRSFDADLVIAVPDLRPHTLRGLPVDDHGFLPVDAHGQVSGAPDVYAAGDCAAFPIKQGGLAAQQADAVAAHVAHRAGAGGTPEPTTVVLRARMLTGAGDLWLRRDLLKAGDRGEVATHALWWPPGKIAGRYIAPHLQALRDAAAGVPHEPAHGRVMDPAPATEDVPIPRHLDLLGDPTTPHPAP